MYSPGGRLFDHIAAHGYLEEDEAAGFFSQLISGIWYIHQKKIAHCNLKLENILLDRNGNLVISDFYFAQGGANDRIMQTSSCYAAPDTVISGDRYPGTAADIWSCGTILYAMLAGHNLPFEDDPAICSGKNGHPHYKSTIGMTLFFPGDWITTDARDLLNAMLAPDPTRRPDIDSVASHRWLSAYAGTPRTDDHLNVFGKTVGDLEYMELQNQRRRRSEYERLVATMTTKCQYIIDCDKPLPALPQSGTP